MKKLFVSVPMKGRTEEEIKASIAKMHAIAEAYEGEKLELIDSFISEEPPVESIRPIWYLGKALEKLSTANIFITVDNYWNWPGCSIERNTADTYGIKCYDVDISIVCEDIVARTECSQAVEGVFEF